MRVMQMSSHDVVNVSGVRDSFVAAPAPVLMCGLVPFTSVAGCTALRILSAGIQLVLVGVSVVSVMEMTLMDVIRVIAMHDTGMAALFTMAVVVWIVYVTCRHVLVELLSDS